MFWSCRGDGLSPVADVADVSGAVRGHLLECFPTAWGHGDSNTIGCSGWLGSCDQAHVTGGRGGGTGRFGRRRSSQPDPAHAGAGHWSEPEERRGRLTTTSNIWILQRRRGWSVHWAWETVWRSQLDTHAHLRAAAHGVHAVWLLAFYSLWSVFRSQLDVDIKYITWEKTNHKKIGEMNIGFIFLGNLKCMYALPIMQGEVLFPGSGPEPADAYGKQFSAKGRHHDNHHDNQMRKV